MKKWYKSWKIWCMLVAAILLVVLVPVGINEAYKIGEGYITVWTGPEFLSYYGSILGAVSTIFVLVCTIRYTWFQVQYEHAVRVETEKWRRLEDQINSAIVLADPIHIRSIYISSNNKETMKRCAELSQYLCTLLEMLDRIYVLLDEADEAAIHELLNKIRKVATDDVLFVRCYNDILTQSNHESNLDEGKIGEKIIDYWKNEYSVLLVQKQRIFSNIYTQISKKSFDSFADIV